MVVLKLIRLMMIVVLLLAGVVGIVIGTTVNKLLAKPDWVLGFARLWYRVLLRILNVEVSVNGKYQHQGLLICSNHISWLDIPVLGSVIPTYFLSKAELRKIPVLGWLAHHAGTLFIQRGGNQIEEVKQLMHDYLSQDHCLAFFPEATTGNGNALRQFHPRLFAAAIESDTPLLPISLQYVAQRQSELNIDFGDESLATNLWRVLGRWKTHVNVSILPVIQTGELERKVLAETALNIIADSLNLPPERRGLNFRAPLPESPPPSL